MASNKRQFVPDIQLVVDAPPPASRRLEILLVEPTPLEERRHELIMMALLQKQRD
jgi:hypothetical protein